MQALSVTGRMSLSGAMRDVVTPSRAQTTDMTTPVPTRSTRVVAQAIASSAAREERAESHSHRYNTGAAEGDSRYQAVGYAPDGMGSPGYVPYGSEPMKHAMLSELLHLDMMAQEKQKQKEMLNGEFQLSMHMCDVYIVDAHRYIRTRLFTILF